MNSVLEMGWAYS